GFIRNANGWSTNIWAMTATDTSSSPPRSPPPPVASAPVITPWTVPSFDTAYSAVRVTQPLTPSMLTWPGAFSSSPAKVNPAPAPGSSRYHVPCSLFPAGRTTATDSAAATRTPAVGCEQHPGSGARVTGWRPDIRTTSSTVSGAGGATVGTT